MHSGAAAPEPGTLIDQPPIARVTDEHVSGLKRADVDEERMRHGGHDIIVRPE